MHEPVQIRGEEAGEAGEVGMVGEAGRTCGGGDMSAETYEVV